MVHALQTLQVIAALKPGSASSAVSLLQLSVLLLKQGVEQGGDDGAARIGEAGDCAARALRVNDDKLGQEHKTTLQNIQVGERARGRARARAGARANGRAGGREGAQAHGRKAKLCLWPRKLGGSRQQAVARRWQQAAIATFCCYWT